MTASAVLSTCYSLPPVASADDPVLTRINNFMHRIESAARPGEYLVELFPWMLRLPKWMAKWHRDADEAHERDTRMFMEFHMDAKHRVVSGLSDIIGFFPAKRTRSLSRRPVKLALA